ncbi:MAG: sel1 repeat family protein [Clostridiales bacterium]|nr:sel1 repeat family protein [Clostridiales bacterium]
MSDVERLKDIIRFEIEPGYFDRDYSEDSFEGVYKVAYQDLIEACKNMLRLKVGFETYDDWYYYVTETLSENYENASDREHWRVALWGETDTDMLQILYYALQAVSYDEYLFEYPSTLTDMLSQIVGLAEDHEYNKGRDVSEWRISQLHRNILIRAFDEKVKHMTAPQKARYISIINEECEKEKIEAMRLKGYSCYGGNDLYECDWEESRKLITRLFELTEYPQYANTLGYIYYYGRCNGGVPEYEKAFQYYSIGAANDLLESMYKLADMFKGGKGCIKSERTSDHIIEKLYADVRPRFLNGEDANFADIALRKASIKQRYEDYYNAYKHYLEADCAIKKRLKKNDFFGYVKVQENITKSLDEVKALMSDGFFVDELEITHPYNLFDLLDDEHELKISIKKIGENRYRFKFKTTKKSEYKNLFLIYPELDGYKYADTFECEVTTDKPIYYYNDKSEEIIVNGLVGKVPGEFIFCYEGEDVFFLSGAKFIVRKDELSLRTRD